jgi:hypothetical protein
MKVTFVSLCVALALLVGGFNVVAAQRPVPGTPSTSQSETHPTTQVETASDKGKRHGLFGTVTFKGVGTFTVLTRDGTKVVVTVTPSTKFHIPTKRNATFADLEVGDRVAVNGTPTASGLTAKQVAVAPGKPSITHRVGIVKSYTPGVSITIQDSQGDKETFKLTAQTKIRNSKGTGIALGDRVTVVSRRDPSSDVFTASAIVVHPN